MPLITVEIENEADALKFLYVAKNMKFVNNAFINDDELSENDWIFPGRSATNDEISAMIDQAESEVSSGNLLTIEESRKYINELLSDS